uniref:(northern house mosquito) hypothetical protein n=1 Tax=Culex pipiens TaxID=7175 RepID=A0A8D8DBT2_CULPI
MLRKCPRLRADSRWLRWSFDTGRSTFLRSDGYDRGRVGCQYQPWLQSDFGPWSNQLRGGYWNDPCAVYPIPERPSGGTSQTVDGNFGKLCRHQEGLRFHQSIRSTSGGAYCHGWTDTLRSLPCPDG